MFDVKKDGFIHFAESEWHFIRDSVSGREKERHSYLERKTREMAHARAVQFTKRNCALRSLCSFTRASVSESQIERLSGGKTDVRTSRCVLCVQYSLLSRRVQMRDASFDVFSAASAAVTQSLVYSPRL